MKQIRDMSSDELANELSEGKTEKEMALILEIGRLRDIAQWARDANRVMEQTAAVLALTKTHPYKLRDIRLMLDRFSEF